MARRRVPVPDFAQVEQGTRRHGEFWNQYLAARQPSTPKGQTSEADARWEEFQAAGPGSPDVIYEPTASSNPADPRTAGMRYWKHAQVLVIEWGDGGAPYAYYDVTPEEVRRMLRVKSPGRAINRWLNQHPYGRIG